MYYIVVIDSGREDNGPKAHDGKEGITMQSEFPLPTLLAALLSLIGFEK